MAKYTITYSCGHTTVEQLYGPERNRQSYIEYCERGRVCPDCYAAVRERERTEANTKAAEANQAAGLPALTGTPKQIAWAESIRAKALADRYSGEAVAMVLACEDMRTRQTEARYWIDTRDRSSLDWVRIAMWRTSWAQALQHRQYLDQILRDAASADKARLAQVGQCVSAWLMLLTADIAPGKPETALDVVRRWAADPACIEWAVAREQEAYARAAGVSKQIANESAEALAAAKAEAAEARKLAERVAGERADQAREAQRLITDAVDDVIEWSRKTAEAAIPKIDGEWRDRVEERQAQIRSLAMAEGRHRGLEPVSVQEGLRRHELL